MRFYSAGERPVFQRRCLRPLERQPDACRLQRTSRIGDQQCAEAERAVRRRDSWPGGLLGIDQRSIRQSHCRGRHARRLDGAFAQNVKHLVARCEQMIRDDAAMASPPHGLGAHDGCPRLRPKLPQPLEAQAEVFAHRVVGVIVEARVVPEGVGLGRDVALESAQAPERSQMLVTDLECASEAGRTSRLNWGLVLDRGTVLTSTTSLTSASCKSATNASVERVEWPMVKNGFGGMHPNLALRLDRARGGT